MEPSLLEAFREPGVVRIEYVAAFPSQDDAWVWLGTATDAERDALTGSKPQVLSEVRRIAEHHGFSPKNITGVTVQSEERSLATTREVGSTPFADRTLMPR